MQKRFGKSHRQGVAGALDSGGGKVYGGNVNKGVGGANDDGSTKTGEGIRAVLIQERRVSRQGTGAGYGTHQDQRKDLGRDPHPGGGRSEKGGYRLRKAGGGEDRAFVRRDCRKDRGGGESGARV